MVPARLPTQRPCCIAASIRGQGPRGLLSGWRNRARGPAPISAQGRRQSDRHADERGIALILALIFSILLYILVAELVVSEIGRAHV